MHAIFFDPPLQNTFLAYQFKEIYIDKIYDQFLSGKSNLNILDIGASGLTPYYFSGFAKKVYAVEPSLQHFDILMKTVEHNKTDNVLPINKAIYIKSGKYPLFHNQNPTMFSLHQSVNDNTSQPEEVEAITFPQLFAEHSIDHIDLCKLDIEGTETELICSTSFKDVADKIGTMIIEQHEWSGRHPNQLLEGLRNTGFKNISNIPSDANIIVATK